ncbi:MFS transporter, DHA2 family, multidrug resistance protein [Bryocella elongata]|uniref:MFS transporter, DHA2 family, multidrug resistance protein n=1 Tax=Bryocella elongata TaxID=863522 RepID=A0A1H6A4M4_9BACT|nr:DHA2 family efflux MFS transporter permease subunit [Bryocella elongata]SEG43678.1 MFS transporter, DHA2 family, multidrug resistance protein [Bryocella elongata]
MATATLEIEAPVAARPAAPVFRVVNPWIIALTVTLATFMELLDTSIANVSLPYIAGGLGRSFDEVTWVLTTYLVANAVVLPMSAWLSRTFGRKNYYMACVALFTITSLMCGIAPSLEFMLVARVLQGIGGGGLAPVEQAILVDTFPPAKRAAAFALYTVAIVTAPAIGPVIGGYITDNYNWRWIFFLNIPIGLLSLYLTNRLIQDPPAFTAERMRLKAEKKQPKIDVPGIALVGLGSAALEIVLDRGQIDDWFGSSLIVKLVVISSICWIVAIWWELRTKDPIIDLRLLKSRNFAIAVALLFLFGFTLFATTTMIPQVLQSLYGYRAIDAGLVLGPGALVITVLAPIAAQLVQRKIVKPQVLLAFSLTTICASMLYYSGMTLQSDYTHYALARAFQGLGYGFFFVPLNVIAYSQLTPEQNNRASSLTNFFRNWGGSVGVAFVTTMSERRQNFHQERLSAALSPSNHALQQATNNLTQQLQAAGYSHADAARAAALNLYEQFSAQTRMLAFMDCFRIIAWTAALALPLVFFIKKFAIAGKAPEGH